jgi:hypothetical protein
LSMPSTRKTLMQHRKLQTEGSSRSLANRTTESQDENEETPLVKAKKHTNYLK